MKAEKLFRVSQSFLNARLKKLFRKDCDLKLFLVTFPELLVQGVSVDLYITYRLYETMSF